MWRNTDVVESVDWLRAHNQTIVQRERVGFDDPHDAGSVAGHRNLGRGGGGRHRSLDFENSVLVARLHINGRCAGLKSPTVRSPR